VGKSLLVEYFEELPPQTGTAQSSHSAARLRRALGAFKRKIAKRYTEGTLQRLLFCEDQQTRLAAVVALGLLGTMQSNRVVASLLHDADALLCHKAAETLWSLWLRADEPVNNRELHRLMRLDDPDKALAGFAALIRKAPQFAEAYNQRALQYFRLGEYQRAIDDCETVLKLNPVHYGAISGMAQCFLKLRKPRQALKAFRRAFRLHPGLEGIGETIRELEDALGEEKGRDDKNR
jgi:tetratricopeptide (TPR) repeat protein